MGISVSLSPLFSLCLRASLSVSLSLRFLLSLSLVRNESVSEMEGRVEGHQHGSARSLYRLNVIFLPILSFHHCLGRTRESEREGETNDREGEREKEERERERETERRKLPSFRNDQIIINKIDF